MTASEKLEAIQQLIDGNWDHPILSAVGPLFTNLTDNIQTVLDLELIEF
ncbi:hypothetical protein [Thalassobius sp. Cn5-15]|nr:hypothetical protein [Thalassobius sp. Cn5-15]MCG7492420.1 hypothetical protein [Thalassobius sp. Cn5-15]